VAAAAVAVMAKVPGAAPVSSRLLPSWFDVDTEADLRRLRRELATTSGGPARTAAFVRERVS
jgi:hypothetical protein